MNNSNDSIFAPFNFVPLSDYILFPKWAKQISHDIPFSDGISGKIELKINTITPTFVRNGSNRDVKDPRFSFVGSEDNLFIPATSIKGAIRSVLEITSFGKMGKVKNESFDVRDLDSKPYRKKVSGAHCGWLKLEGGEYKLYDCGEPGRISPEEIDANLGTSLAEFMYKGNLTPIKKRGDNDFHSSEDQKNKIDPRTAKFKYDMVFDKTKLKIKFSKDHGLCNSIEGNRTFVKIDENGEPGIIVFTGQSSNRTTIKKEKYFEFVFPEMKTEPVLVPEHVMKEFVSIHKNSYDYKEFRRKELEEGKRIPVFFKYKNGTNDIDSIGLAYLYKYPSSHSIYDGLRDNDFSEEYDMAECIFGSENKDRPLKGRVYFGHAFATKATMQETREVCLSTPHPSYYPLYLGNGQSWNTENIRIAGRKRYPTRDNIWNHNEGTGDMLSKLTPVTDAEFTETIVFHNLRKTELGALIYALTFGGNADCYHSIGAGKPLGYGKCSVCITNITDTENAAINMDECVADFESLLDKEYSSWRIDSSLKELFAMARGIKKESLGKFRYMHMDTDQKKNEFKKAKDAYYAGKQMGTFTQITEGTVENVKFRGDISNNTTRLSFEEKLKQRIRDKEEHEKVIFEKYMLAVEHYDTYNYPLALKMFCEILNDTINYRDCNRYVLQIEDVRNSYKNEGDRLFDKQEWERALHFYNQYAEFDDACNDKIRQCEDNIQLEIENKKNSFKQQGDTLRAQGKYAEAREMYVKCEQYGGACSQEILACVEAAKKENQTVTDIVKFTSFAKIGTIAGQIKKCKALGKTITLDDCASMSKIFAEEFPNMKSSERKKWLSFDNWKPIVNELGEEGAQIIFLCISNL